MTLEIKHLQTSEAKIDLSPQKDYFAEWQMAELKVSKAEKKIRRLKRALWLARAISARNKVRFFGWAFDCYDIDLLVNIDGHKYKMPQQNRLLPCHH